MSMTVISSLLEDLGLTSKEDVTRELKPGRIRKNAADLANILNMLKQTMNPFSRKLDKDSLFNIGSGKSASEETKNFLLSVIKIGETAQNTFVNECTENRDRFENETIKRQKLSTFANEGAKRKLKKNGQVKEVKMERDLFAKILCLALDHEIDMEEIFTYPLTVVPLAFCHFDGTLRETPKSKLSKELKESVQSSQPTYVDVHIIDGNFYLYLLIDLPATFGGVSKKILSKLCSLKSRRVDIVFDTIQSPSIKDYERDQRAAAQDRTLNFQILGESQRRPSDFRKALRNDAFKDALIGFLVQSRNCDSVGHIISNKELHITHREKCYRFTSDAAGKVIREEILSLRSSHEEADCRMFFHLYSLSDEKQNVVIRSNDVDVLLIALGQASVLKCDVWIEQGFASDNSLEYIHINHIVNHLGVKTCEAWPGLHAFTGCDYTPAFSGRGKIKPYKLMRQSVEFQEAFISLGRSRSIANETVRTIEQFVCKLYGSKKKIDNVDALRLRKFYSAYKPKKKKRILAVKDVNAISMPPCFSVLYQQIKRDCLISNCWLNAYQSDPPDLEPEDYGYELIEGKYFPKWHEGDITPPSIESITATTPMTDEDQEDNEEYGYASDEDEDDNEDEEDDVGSLYVMP